MDVVEGDSNGWVVLNSQCFGHIQYYCYAVRTPMLFQ